MTKIIVAERTCPWCQNTENIIWSTHEDSLDFREELGECLSCGKNFVNVEVLQFLGTRIQNEDGETFGDYLDEGEQEVI